MNLKRLVATDTENPATADGHGIGERERSIAGVNGGVLHNQIRKRRNRRERQQRSYIRPVYNSDQSESSIA